ncbi:hypothetical protein BDZ94DRAFT_1325830 [Collybia nuda]|uniref:Uncharacterized protein n=1 Tax=Collybia nuda TaxID=64659 RepID=A0A9P5XYH2_9AGAR|nr:hypothetical protein BDZ94DRAFT_1325830 [Collybia nuda]
MQPLRVVAIPFLITVAQLTIVGARSLGGQNLSIIRLGARQSNPLPVVPAQCKTTCDPVNSLIFSNTCPVSQCCTPSFEMAYFNCIICVGGVANLEDYSAPQNILDRILSDCATRGRALPKLTFPGQNPDRPLSTLPFSGSATHITSLSRSAASNTTTRVNPPITPVGSSGSSSSFTQITITSLSVGTDSTPAPTTSAPAPTGSTISTSAGTRAIKSGQHWASVGLFVVGGLLSW